MSDVISEVAPSQSTASIALFVVLSLGLAGTGAAIAHGVFVGMSQSLLGVLMAAGFAMLALMVLVYSRLRWSHRIVLEYGEDLW